MESLETEPREGVDRYVVVSADSHAGASIAMYREYLESRWYDEFDAWVATYVDGWAELERRAAEGDSMAPLEIEMVNQAINWDSDLRQQHVEADGVVGEVLFPNTVPPFFPRHCLGSPNPTERDDYERRLAGIRAHNRWLVDFCAELPGRRAGIAQIFVNDVDDAVRDIRTTKESGLTGGVLLPGISPVDGLPELFDPVYKPIWDVCEELGVPLNHHGGGAGNPRLMSRSEPAMAVLYVESHFWGHRALWQLIFGGVFERHPALALIFTEQGTGWVAGTLSTLDHMAARMHVDGSLEALFSHGIVTQLSLTPREYFARNCWIGASLLTPAETALRDEIGVDKIMWGSDYPHGEGTYPFSKESLQANFAGASLEETRLMVGATAAELYGLDEAALAHAASAIGPSVEDVSGPPTDLPEDARRICTFDPNDVVRSW